MQPKLLGLRANLITQFHHGTTKYKQNLPLLRQKKAKKGTHLQPEQPKKGDVWKLTAQRPIAIEQRLLGPLPSNLEKHVGSKPKDRTTS